MRKKLLPLIMLMIVCTMVACDKKDYKELTDDNKKEVEVATVSVAEDYTGAYGYITENQVYDYSHMFDKVYQWEDDVKMPFDKPANAKIAWKEEAYPMWSNMYFYDTTREDIDSYVDQLEKEGFLVYSSGDQYNLYKDNFRVCFSYNEYKEVYNIFCYAGNVINERAFTAEDAREMIESNQLLSSNEKFKEYYVFAIENETVKAQGYYEFLVEPVKGDANDWAGTRPYYLLTDGKDVLLFEQNLISQMMPSNVNIVETDGKVELVATTIIVEQTYNSYVGGYELIDNAFVKKWEYDWRRSMDITPIEEIIVSKIEDGEMKFCILSPTEDYDFKKGEKDYWTFKKDYNMSKTQIE